MRAGAGAFLRLLQNEICAGLEKTDGRARFHEDAWKRDDMSGLGGGGGITRVMSEGAVFERAGVNFSEVQGSMPAAMTAKLTGAEEVAPFYATGVSLVLHPRSPMVPTVHANYRYLEVGDKRWLGGGADLTPYYLFEEDALHFHTVFRNACARHSGDYYPRFKRWCDEYFYLPHRKETRGVGGIFFDYLGKDDPEQLPAYWSFVQDAGRAFLPAYLPIVERRRELSWGEAERRFQLLRRGRYVEFNLIWDRGTQFGLHTGGRTESILMSLPPQASWEYCHEPVEGSREAELFEILRQPRDWI